MSLLWEGGFPAVQFIKYKSPSPTCHIQNVKSAGSNSAPYPIEGTSLPSFCSRALKKSDGGMTVEAAIVLPLFLFFFLHLGCVIELIRLHGNLEMALWETGNRMCVCGDVFREFGDSAGIGAMLLGFPVKSEIVSYVGKDYLEQSPLTCGAGGLQFSEGSILPSEGILELDMAYEVSPVPIFLVFSPFRMVNRYYGHLWTGYQIPLGADGKEVDTVYVAETGGVYHESISCTHLKLSLRRVTLEEALGGRNVLGEPYTLCSLCKDMPRQEMVFVTDEGGCYHYAQDCPALKRTIYSMSRTEAEEQYPPCRRCAGSAP